MPPPYPVVIAEPDPCSATTCAPTPRSPAAYAREKRRAAALHADDSHGYNDEKDAWVRAAEAEALRWHAAHQAARP